MDPEILNLIEQIAELRGQLLAMECTVNALVLRLPNQAGVVLEALHATESLAYSRALAHDGSSKSTIAAFERQTERMRLLIECRDLPAGNSNVPSDWAPL